jgi:hypothetical protein
MAINLPIQITSSSVVTAIAGGGGSGGNAGKPIAYISLEKCKWQKNLNQLIVPWDLNFPREICIHNPNTDTLRQYTQISHTDPRFDQDGWDGVQMVYKTHLPTNNAEYLVLYHSS